MLRHLFSVKSYMNFRDLKFNLYSAEVPAKPTPLITLDDDLHANVGWLL